MRSSRKLLFIVVMVFLAAGLATLAFCQKRAREHRLSDGSILRLEKISYGKRVEFQLTGWFQRLKDRLQKQLPRSWSNHLFKPPPAARVGVSAGSWSMVTVTHTNNDALWIWISRREAEFGKYQDVSIRGAELLDSHGCCLAATQLGGSYDGRLAPRATGRPGLPQSSVEWLRFEAFPRHEKHFRLRVYDSQGKFLTEFRVSNPEYSPARPTNWQVESFPIAKSSNDVTFILAGMKIKTNDLSLTTNLPRFRQPYEIDPSFRFLERGLPATNWQALDMELHDSSGNFAPEMFQQSRFLCPWEPAWKLRVKFCGSEESRQASNVLWTLRGVKVPGAGEFMSLDEFHTFPETRIEALALAGPGEFTYSNDIPIKATAELPGENGKYLFGESSSHGSFGGWQNVVRTVSFNTHHIALVLTGPLDDDQRLTVRATDDQGRKVYADTRIRRSKEKDSTHAGKIHYLDGKPGFGQSGSDSVYYSLDLPTDSKTVDLTFCVHHCSVVEFIFKPPGR